MPNVLRMKRLVRPARAPEALHPLENPRTRPFAAAPPDGCGGLAASSDTPSHASTRPPPVGDANRMSLLRSRTDFTDEGAFQGFGLFSCTAGHNGSAAKGEGAQLARALAGRGAGLGAESAFDGSVFGLGDGSAFDASGFGPFSEPLPGVIRALTRSPAFGSTLATPVSRSYTMRSPRIMFGPSARATLPVMTTLLPALS